MPTPALTFPTMALRPLLALSRPPLLRAFTTTAICSKAAPSKALPPRTPILDSEIVENFLKGSGPGGQKINKTSSAVQLIHLPTGIVVKYQDTRSRELNRKMARRILQDRIEEATLGDDARTRVRAREASKKKKSAEKKRRRKYRALEGKGEEEGGEEGVEGEGEGEGEDQVEAEAEQAGRVEQAYVEGTGKAGGG